MTDNDELPAFSRTQGPKARGDKVELRGEITADIISVIDAESMAVGKDRIRMVEEILGDWAKKRLHAASLLYRVSRNNPALSEAFGGSSE
jgi:hypothetical protein